MDGVIEQERCVPSLAVCESPPLLAGLFLSTGPQSVVQGDVIAMEKLDSALKTLKDNFDVVMNLRMISAATLEHIRSQGQIIENQIKHQFMKLHQFLHEEEEARLSVLKEEELKKIDDIKKRDEELMNRIFSLSEIISRTEQDIAADDLTLLQNFNSAMERTQSSSPNPKGFHGALIDEARHLSNLKFRVWEKMQEVAPY
ncbi:zinc-binding protein A33-like, partial [Clarias magur]